MNYTSQKSNVKPFLKWAGGKRWLVARHLSIFPSSYKMNMMAK